MELYLSSPYTPPWRRKGKHNSLIYYTNRLIYVYDNPLRVAVAEPPYSEAHKLHRRTPNLRNYTNNHRASLTTRRESVSHLIDHKMVTCQESRGLSPASRVKSQTCPRGIRSGQSGTWTDLFPSALVIPCHYHLSSAPYSSIHLSPTL